jgi:hypothetical protein
MVTTNIFVHNASEHTFNGNLPYNHIMDVAGGKGELAARLVMCYGRNEACNGGSVLARLTSHPNYPKMARTI